MRLITRKVKTMRTMRTVQIQPLLNKQDGCISVLTLAIHHTRLILHQKSKVRLFSPTQEKPNFCSNRYLNAVSFKQSI